MLLPWLRVPDTRSGRIKYLDTCLALVSEEAMAAWLERQANVDLSLWGKGKAKAVRDLLKEVVFLTTSLLDVHATFRKPSAPFHKRESRIISDALSSLEPALARPPASRRLDARPRRRC